LIASAILRNNFVEIETPNGHRTIKKFDSDEIRIFMTKLLLVYEEIMLKIKG